MAGYQCGGCDGAEPAAILITPLNGAETLAVGDNCMPVTWCGILAGVLGLDPERLWDAAVALKQAAAAAEGQDQAPARQPATIDLTAPGEPLGPPLAGTAAAATDGTAIRVTPHTPRPPRKRRPTQ